MSNRPSFTDTFFDVAEVMSRRATCNRRKIGVVVTTFNNLIVAEGYNGSKPGDVHCIDVGCLMEDGHCVRTIHAEDNAFRNVSWAQGVPGSTVYIYGAGPCENCADILIKNGVKEVCCTSPDDQYLWNEWNEKVYNRLRANGIETYIYCKKDGSYELEATYLLMV